MTATLLASCSATSDTDMAMFGFNPQYGATGVAMPQAAQPTVAATTGEASATEGATADATPQFAFDETDPSLPEQVASVPTMTNREIATSADPATMPADGEAQVAAAATNESADAEALAATTEPAPTAEPEVAVQPAPAAAPEPPKRGFLSAFFSQQPAQAAPSPIVPQQAPAPAQQAAEASRPIIDLEANRAPVSMATKQSRPVMISTASISENALPGVRDNANLFEITRRNGIDDDSDIDLNEDGGLYQVAYAPGLARLAPNGLMKQHDDVDVSCLRPSLVRVLKSIESRFGQKVVITSGFRSAERNRRARGARNSLHMACAAADIQVAGVSKWTLAEYVRSMPGRGGVGTYCHTESVHVDVGPERDWNWRCRRRG
ncbi:MAG: D-Ala-D-Ala carboxypeptidase family metallohydrolase [Aliihoeflea sp.]|uniref:D-Ala-D-Ala carboxypeptidase family metallohydrolase n=1 Tax=Aliihoeflea sp. TaxID=2608088 RepID=UPI0040336D9B